MIINICQYQIQNIWPLTISSSGGRIHQLVYKTISWVFIEIGIVMDSRVNKFKLISDRFKPSTIQNLLCVLAIVGDRLSSSLLLLTTELGLL